MQATCRGTRKKKNSMVHYWKCEEPYKERHLTGIVEHLQTACSDGSPSAFRSELWQPFRGGVGQSLLSRINLDRAVTKHLRISGRSAEPGEPKIPGEDGAGKICCGDDESARAGKGWFSLFSPGPASRRL